jgi:hypothetical protein
LDFALNVKGMESASCTPIQFLEKNYAKCVMPFSRAGESETSALRASRAQNCYFINSVEQMSIFVELASRKKKNS